MNASKNQNPREGIETCTRTKAIHTGFLIFKKPKSPRGDWNISLRGYIRVLNMNDLQKTKIPARGLKHVSRKPIMRVFPYYASKNQNPREGIETLRRYFSLWFKYILYFKKPKSPRGDWNRLEVVLATAALVVVASKNQNPREGIETLILIRRYRNVWYNFKKPKSPRGDWNQEERSRWIGN
mgnify:CR=1 FL=1